MGLRWLSLLCGKDDGGTRLREDSVGVEGQSAIGLGPTPHREFRQVGLEEGECLLVKLQSAARLPAPLPPPQPVLSPYPSPGCGI